MRRINGYATLRPHSHPVPEATNRHVVYKSYSCKERKPIITKEEFASAANKQLDNNIESHECHIINELIATEQSYVDTLKRGLKNYVSIYENEINLPANLRGKKYFLFGNIEQIVELHENELLPMLNENRNAVAKICERFYELLMENRFYGYVLYAINKSNSEKICIEEKLYFKNIQELAGDKLGIDSFLVQPIQRLPRYGLLFEELISKYFKGDIVKYKTEVALCCKVEKHIRNLLETVNSAMQINDIQECFDINLLYQGCFKRCFDFNNYDHAQRRTYKCRLFIFERAVVYTEIIKEKKLIYRGYYPRERIGIVVGKKNFSLFYQKRKIQECDFSGESQEPCVDLIMAMMRSFAIEEKEKIQEKYQKVSDIFRRPGPRLQLHPSSRYSTDSGVGSVLSGASNTSDEANPRTTWYTESFVTSGA
ncbi:unnamed protein product [Hermetia illucens]|uniref:DH domain-containing protein n=1 Tax=Hermetia illucens TaxID=343691 RepID=A0A7R8UXU7_HERIL|nr:unnamed protein product [Hermetia illucens]